MGLALLLAQMCVAEIGLHDDPSECRVMWAVNARTADRRNQPLDEHTRRFNAGFRNDSSKLRERRPWILALQLEQPDVPRGWPQKASWAKHEPMWRGYALAALEWVHRGQATECRQATDYGGRCEVAAGACDPPKPCYRAVRCLGGRTRQAYWDTRGCRR